MDSEGRERELPMIRGALPRLERLKASAQFGFRAYSSRPIAILRGLWRVAYGPNGVPDEQQAQEHCPKDTIVWLDPQSGMYQLKGHGSYGPDDAAGLVQAAVAVFGGIDVLINNVGGGGGGARIADSTDDDWRGAIERNLIQTVRMMRLALPHMKGRTGGSVINVASISGWSPQLAMSGQYSAAKAALIFETERWALEFVPHGIRVNTVSPGSILVAGNGWDRYRLANQEYFDDYVRHGFPMGRLGTAEEVADVIAFLASPRAHWINGRNIPVDGLEQPHAPLDRRPF